MSAESRELCAAWFRAPTRYLALRIEHMASKDRSGLRARQGAPAVVPARAGGGCTRWKCRRQGGLFPAIGKLGSEKFEGEAIRHRASTP